MLIGLFSVYELQGYFKHVLQQCCDGLIDGVRGFKIKPHWLTEDFCKKHGFIIDCRCLMTYVLAVKTMEIGPN